MNSISGKFTPPAGQTLLIVGQDYDTVTDYMRANPQPVPAGFTTYTSVKNLEGLSEPTDYGAGTVYMGGLVDDYPHAVLALGLNVVDYLDEIVDGKADGQIDILIDLLKATNRPVLVRFGYEVDGEWNRHNPQLFVEAWKIFYERVQESGATNIALVWQTATYCGGTYLDQPIDAWYPGDEFVDWIGFSYFTQADCNNFPINELMAFAREHQKPVMIAEAAPQRYQTSGLNYSVTGAKFTDKSAEQIWDEWYQPFFKFVEDNQDSVRAVAYINAYWDEQEMWGPPYGQGFWGDSRVQANPLIQDRWLQEIGSSNWIHGSEALFESLNN